MLDSNSLYVVDEDGSEKRMTILFTFENEQYGRQYVVFEDPQDDSGQVFASAFDDEGSLLPLESEATGCSQSLSCALQDRSDQAADGESGADSDNLLEIPYGSDRADSPGQRACRDFFRGDFPASGFAVAGTGRTAGRRILASVPDVAGME